MAELTKSETAAFDAQIAEKMWWLDDRRDSEVEPSDEELDQLCRTAMQQMLATVEENGEEGDSDMAAYLRSRCWDIGRYQR
jgi:hypothetical protein